MKQIAFIMSINIIPSNWNGRLFPFENLLSPMVQSSTKIEARTQQSTLNDIHVEYKDHTVHSLK